MSYGGGHHRHGGAIGVFAIVAAIAFAFGLRTARIVVGAAIIVALACLCTSCFAL